MSRPGDAESTSRLTAGKDTTVHSGSRLMRFALVLGLVVTLSFTIVGSGNAATFELAVGGVRDACTGAHLGGAALTFTQVGTSEHPPSPIRVTTNPGGQFQTRLAPGDYSVVVTLDGYSQVGNTDGDPVNIIFQRTGLVNHFSFILHPPSPC